MGKVITIDGPAASGKTSVSRDLAKRMGYYWVSTGAFYRGLAYVALQTQTSLDDEMALSRLSGQGDVWRVEMAEHRTHVYFRDHDVTEKISEEVVGNAASKISHFPKVREALLAEQRDCAKRTQGLVAEGRDCGTVVFPEAVAKVYLTAKQENRAERRAKEQGLDAQAIGELQRQRDEQDSTRKAAPLQIPESAFVIDTTDLSLVQVVDAVEKFVRSKF